MRRIEKLPPAFKRYRKMGGVLDFAMFEEADGGEEEILSAIASAYGFDTEKLRTLGCRRINDRAFFGDWYDRAGGLLIRRGSWTAADGRELHNPSLVATEGLQLTSGAAPCPDAGTGGQFAYAFSSPPYPLRPRPREIQALFEEIRDLILPPLHWHEILDWASPRLPEVSDYFRIGMQWWGVFLFSIHVPALRRLTIIAGSTSD